MRVHRVLEKGPGMQYPPFYDGPASPCVKVLTAVPFHKYMAQNRTASSSGPDSAVHLYLKDKGHYFEYNNVYIMARDDKEVKETVYIKLK